MNKSITSLSFILIVVVILKQFRGSSGRIQFPRSWLITISVALLVSEFFWSSLIPGCPTIFGSGLSLRGCGWQQIRFDQNNLVHKIANTNSIIMNPDTPRLIVTLCVVGSLFKLSNIDVNEVVLVSSRVRKSPNWSSSASSRFSLLC